MRRNLATHYSLLATRSGFTLMEVLIAIGVVMVLTGIAFVYLDPPKRLASLRNDEREAHLNSLMLAIGERIAANRGSFNCASGELPTSTKLMAFEVGNYDIAPCLVPSYLPALPVDPSAEGAYYASATDYNTGYEIVQNASTGQITLSAPSAELGATTTITR